MVVTTIWRRPIVKVHSPEFVKKSSYFVLLFNQVDLESLLSNGISGSHAGNTSSNH